jgi:ABC-type sugar transport system permease subunit
MEAERRTASNAAPAAPAAPQRTLRERFGQRLEDAAPGVFIWPAVAFVLLLAVFPLFVSLYLSVSTVRLVPGGYDINFVGLSNFERLFFGSQRRNFLGRWDQDASFFSLPGVVGWVCLVVLAGFFAYMLYRHAKRCQFNTGPLLLKLGLTAGVGVVTWLIVNFAVAAEGAFAGTWLEEKYWLLTALPGLAVVITAAWLQMLSMVLRLFIVTVIMALAWLSAITLTGDNLPGTLVVTLVFVFVGVLLQYVLGLGLAMLLTQRIPGRRFFRIIFLLPMLITPVGVGFLFRMMSDTTQGPFAPLWAAAGLTDFSWVATATGARLAIIITDTWQWTPFMFIILLAAMEGISTDPIEAAKVDGANRWQVFRFIILPEIIPVSVTLVLIRMIEAFKIIDLPRIMTRGGPGTATESVTLYAFNQWKASASSIGFASAIAYLLLFVVTLFALVLVNIGRRRLLELFQ